MLLIIGANASAVITTGQAPLLAAVLGRASVSGKKEGDSRGCRQLILVYARAGEQGGRMELFSGGDTGSADIAS